MACIPREALISALVSRAKKGEPVGRADLEPLLRAGVPMEQLLAAFAGLDAVLGVLAGIAHR